MGLFDFAKKLVDPGAFVFKGDSQKLAEQQYSTEKDIALKNYDEQVRMNNENIRMQQEAFDYQKELNSMQMEREDNAVLRRVQDLKNAGLSPTLAAGSAASATPVHSGTAPQGVAPQMATPSDIKVRQAMFKESLMKDRMALAMSVMGNIADISRTKAETEFIKAKGDYQDIFNKYADDLLHGRVIGQNIDNDIKAVTYDFQQATFSDRKEKIKKEIDNITSQIDINKVVKDIRKNDMTLQFYEMTYRNLQNQKLGIEIGEEATKALSAAYTYQWFSSRNLPVGAVSDNALLLALLAAANGGNSPAGAVSVPIGDDGLPVYGNVPIRDGHGTTLPSGMKSYGIADVIEAINSGLGKLTGNAFDFSK